MEPQKKSPGEVSSGKVSAEGKFAVGGVLFAVVFMVFAALIFTLIVPPPSKSARAGEGNGDDDSSLPTLPLSYPPAKRVDASDVFFGTKVPDPYRWLEDISSADVQAWVAAQNKLARSYLDELPGRAELKAPYQQLLHIDTISAPGRAGDRYFY